MIPKLVYDNILFYCNSSDHYQHRLVNKKWKALTEGSPIWESVKQMIALKQIGKLSFQVAVERNEHCVSSLDQGMLATSAGNTLNIYQFDPKTQQFTEINTCQFQNEQVQFTAIAIRVIGKKILLLQDVQSGQQYPTRRLCSLTYENGKMTSRNSSIERNSSFSGDYIVTTEHRKISLTSTLGKQNRIIDDLLKLEAHFINGIAIRGAEPRLRFLNLSEDTCYFPTEHIPQCTLRVNQTLFLSTDSNFVRLDLIEQSVTKLEPWSKKTQTTAKVIDLAFHQGFLWILSTHSTDKVRTFIRAMEPFRNKIIHRQKLRIKSPSKLFIENNQIFVTCHNQAKKVFKVFTAALPKNEQ